jgi:hypothetical protein
MSVGTYKFNAYAMVNGCRTGLASVNFTLGDATCSLQAINVTLLPTTGSNKFYQLAFNVQNTCDPLLGGINFEITGMSLSWSGYGGIQTVKEVRISDPSTGTLITTTPLNKSSGQSFTFTTGNTQTVNAGTTSPTWYVIYSDAMKQGSNTTTFSSIIANTTTPANANDQLLNGTVTP